MRGTVCSLDVKEAFTQTSEEMAQKHGTGSKLFLKLPSQWKGQLAPDIITRMSESMRASTLLAVLSSIYGQATAPLAWAKTLGEFLINKLGFKQSKYDENVYYKRDPKSGYYIYICIYVDDVWIFSLDSAAASSTAVSITERFTSTAISYLCGEPGKEWHEGVECTFVTNQYTIAIEEGQPYLFANQADYMSNAVVKLVSKEYLTEAEAHQRLTVLDPKVFLHQTLSQDCEENPLLNSEQLTALRGILNTIAYATTTRPELATAIQTCARGQAAGRLRHLQAARKIVSFANTFRERGFKFLIPDVSKENPQLWLSADFDSSLGNTGPISSAGDGTSDKVRLEADGHARMGVCLFVAAGNFTDPKAANEAGWAFYTRSTLNPTLCVGTTEAELCCATWCAKELIGAVNFAQEVLP